MNGYIFGANRIYNPWSVMYYLASNLLDNVYNALMNKDIESFKENIRQYLKRTISYYDTETEGFFHGLMLGIAAGLESCYLIKSNREEVMGEQL